MNEKKNYLQTSETNNRIITRLRLDKNKLNTCQGKYNNSPMAYDLRTCPRALPQYHRKYVLTIRMNETVLDKHIHEHGYI